MQVNDLHIDYQFIFIRFSKFAFVSYFSTLNFLIMINNCKLYFLVLPILFSAASCSSYEPMTGNKALSVYVILIIVLVFVLYYINKIRRDKKHEKANNSIISFNKKLENILAKLDTPHEKIKALKMAIDRIEDHQEYNKNRSWKNSLLITAYLHMTVIYSRLGDEENLLETFEHILDLNPRHAMTYYNRGSIYSNRGEYEKALADLTKAAKYNPTYSNVFNNRGLVYDKLGEYEKAVNDYSHAIVLHDSAISRFNRGNAYKSLKRYAEALADYKQYLELAPYNQAELKEEVEIAIKEMEQTLNTK